MNLVRVTAPKPILSLAEVKKHLNVIGYDDDDGLIDELIEAATAELDCAGWFGRALGPQTWDATFAHGDLPCGASGELLLPLRPLIEVVSIGYFDADDAAQTWADYLTDGENAYLGPATIRPLLTASWPAVACRPDALTVRFRCGYAKGDGESPEGEVEAVPAPLKAAIKLAIGDLYANRGTRAADAFTTHDRLINPFRVYA